RTIFTSSCRITNCRACRIFGLSPAEFKPDCRLKIADFGWGQPDSIVPPCKSCLIESDRNREKTRLTYSDFKDLALPLASALQSDGFRGEERTAIIMSNQSKWLISAYAIFYCGGVLVLLDYKLTPSEQLRLLAHSHASYLVIEYYLWRAMTQ